ncbi:DUF6415 family natural product biosynthesis protein [Streptomyces sp. NPDC056244]|uniref:DUF6415 family natural product biosynthesis protein n=1 Tax=unclassified Streptomyces TaxID=2593676 RepID=UPI0035E20034
MPEPTARTAAPDIDCLPLDFVTMGDTARSVIDSDVRLSDEDLEMYTLRLRAHLALLIPEAERQFGRLAPVGVEEARQRLDAGPGSLGLVRYAHCLARSVLSLCARLGHGGEDHDA